MKGRPDKSVVFVPKDFRHLPLDDQTDIRTRMRDQKAVINAAFPEKRVLDRCNERATGQVESQVLEKKNADTKSENLPKQELEKKGTFYPKIDKDLEENGFKAIPEDQLIQGRGINQYVKPGDGIAIKGNDAVVLEKKAPAETSQSGKGLVKDYIKETRADVDKRVANGEITKEVGLHETKLAQAEYSAHNVKDGVTGTKGNNAEIEGKNIKPGYSVSQSESGNAEQALKNRGITEYEKVQGSNGTAIYIWDLPPNKPS